MEVSGLLDLLETGDEIMADKGFQIQDLLAPLGVRLNIPPLLSSNTQMPVDDVFHTRKIAHLRIHVESYRTCKAVPYSTTHSTRINVGLNK